ncbi:MAG TPA: DUF1553 domain-containing protein, partial [Candidatus Dormibacteraeota bacterium]|nr:DUF1553 domain-containing protein [Candidatus Dormibacteraeota bacterium]
SRLKDVRISVLDEDRRLIWERSVRQAPEPKVMYGLTGSDPLEFAGAFADTAQGELELTGIIDEEKKKGAKGWAVNSEDGKPHYLTLLMGRPLRIPDGAHLQVVIEQKAKHDRCPPALLRLTTSADEKLSQYAAIPAPLLESLNKAASARTEEQKAALSKYYRANVAAELKPERDHLARLKKDMADMQAKANTVPIMREVAADQHRKTHIQFRGNYLSLGDEVTEATPSAFEPLPKGSVPNRLGLARWLADTNNPLTARVMANRLWEQIFGVGIVRTSEDFGSQGELPNYPELLDWLACQFRDGGRTGSAGNEPAVASWDVKAFLKMLVTSATYCQSSRVTPELAERDPDNLLLARGPRFRMTAEVVRDQALAVSGLLSQKLYGPPVRPPQPALGLTAAFGGSLDWKTSEGEDRYRRGLYIEWRRTSPYPSMAAFDAPNREVCALRRPRSNTPLQALVTLNDPVFVEAAEALGKRIEAFQGSTNEKLAYGFRLCLARQPHPAELQRLAGFYDQARASYAAKPAMAEKLTTASVTPIVNRKRRAGKKAQAPPPSTTSAKTASPDLAAWTAVGNVLLNLDETLMRP